MLNFEDSASILALNRAGIVLVLTELKLLTWC